MEERNELQQGATTTIGIRPNLPLGNKKLKIGIYSENGKPLLETTYPDDGQIKDAGENTLVLELNHETTRRLAGDAYLSAVIYEADKSIVSPSRNRAKIHIKPTPETRTLK